MSEKITKFTNKVSPLIEGQVPDFIQADHPIFVDFVKDYFKFLEAGRLTLTNVVNYVSLETNTVNFILDEDGERVVTEIGEGTTGLFVVGETITGETSKATATVLVDDSRNAYLYVSGQQLFQTGETITGSTSGSTGTGALSITAPASNGTGVYHFAVGDSGGGSPVIQCNFGNPIVALSSGNADANDHGNFEYEVPSGYFALCTKNIAEHG